MSCWRMEFFPYFSPANEILIFSRKQSSSEILIELGRIASSSGEYSCCARLLRDVMQKKLYSISVSNLILYSGFQTFEPCTKTRMKVTANAKIIYNINYMTSYGSEHYINIMNRGCSNVDMLIPAPRIIPNDLISEIGSLRNDFRRGNARDPFEEG